METKSFSYSKTSVNPNRYVSVTPINPSHTNYMKVEAVLRYLGKNALALNQYKIQGIDSHFFLCSDVKNKIGAELFRLMQCDVVTFMVENKS